MTDSLSNFQIISTIALICTPLVTWVITVLYQNRSEKIRAKRQLFLILIAGRKKNPPPIEFVDALNQIDVVFQNDKRVRLAWREYLDSLHPNSQHFENSNSFLLDLLAEIAITLGYRHLKQTEIDRFYTPQYFQNQYLTSTQLTVELLRVLENSKSYAESESPQERKARLNLNPHI